MTELLTPESFRELVLPAGVLSGRTSVPRGSALDHLNWEIEASVQKWDHDRLDRLGLLLCEKDQLLAEGVLPDEDVLWSRGNLLLNNGINRFINLGIGTASIVAYNNSISRIGTGNGSTAVAAANTDLSAAAGSANRWFEIMDATYPQVAAQTITFVASFATGDGNYAWNEWGIDGGGGTSGNTVGTNTASLNALLNRVVPGTSLGTKTSGIWTLTTTITIS